MAKKSTDVENKTVTFNFGDGIESVVFDLTDMTDEMLIQLALHGASQKIGDSYASAKAQTDGTEIDPAEWSRGQAAGVVAQLLASDWTVRVAGTSAVTDLAQALSEAVGCSIEDAVARLGDADADDKKALRKHPDVAAVLARIKSERATARLAQAEAKAGTGPDLGEFMTG